MVIVPLPGIKCQFLLTTETSKQTIIKKPSKEINESLSVEKIKASDGKTYKFLGSQWAELLPSGKTGLFAKKKIGKELDKLTGRKRIVLLKKEEEKQRIKINAWKRQPSSPEV